MKTLIKSALLLLLVMSLTGCGDDVSSISSEDLVVRDGVYYEKFSEVPFSGKVTGLRNGLMKNGKEEGEWITYHSASLLDSIGNYKNGKKEGEWIRYHDNGQLYSKGNYKNGKTEGEWVSYWVTGQLMFKGNYKNGEREGEWVYYQEQGNLIKEWSGIYKNGVKISD